MVLGANRIETLREVLSSRARASAAGLATVPQFQARRAQFPENLIGLGYFDFQKVDWQALKDRWIEEAKKSPVAKTVSPSKLPRRPRFPTGSGRSTHKSSRGICIILRASRGRTRRVSIGTSGLNSVAMNSFRFSAGGNALPRRALRVLFRRCPGKSATSRSKRFKSALTASMSE